jgi:hypothetical protein
LAVAHRIRSFDAAKQKLACLRAQSSVGIPALAKNTAIDMHQTGRLRLGHDVICLTYSNRRKDGHKAAYPRFKDRAQATYGKDAL